MWNTHWVVNRSRAEDAGPVDALVGGIYLVNALVTGVDGVSSV